MEMNKAWTAKDFKALGVRLSYASNACSETPTEEEKKQLDFVAHACKVFLAEYEKHQ
jgi:nicotinamidase-related amidase